MAVDPALQQVTDRVAKLIAAGDLEAAGKLVASLQATQPLAHDLGFVQLALYKRDAPTALLFAHRAVENGGGALGEQYLALAHLQAGDPAAAIDAARRAVAHDPSPRSRAGFGTVLLAAARPRDAAAVLRQVVAESPRDIEALVNLATACAQLGDYAEAIRCYARAYDLDPANPRVIANLLGMFAELGKWLGALGALELSRKSDPPPELELVFDVATLHLVRLIAEKFPAPGVGADPDRAVTSAIAAARSRSPRVQLAVARTLVELGRGDEARPLVDALAGAPPDPPLDPPERAALCFLQGTYARAAGDNARALELYGEALAADPGCAEACANATRVLLEDGSAGALERAGKLLDGFPAEHVTPELLYNHAAYLARTGRPADARPRLERILRVTGGAGRISQLARQALGELAGAK